MRSWVRRSRVAISSAVWIAAISIPAPAGIRTNLAAGYSLDVPGEFLRSELPSPVQYLDLKQDYYFLEAFVCRDGLPQTTNQNFYYRQFLVYYFPKRTPDEIAAMTADRVAIGGDRKKKLDAWCSTTIVPLGFEEYARQFIAGLQLGPRTKQTIAGYDAAVAEATIDPARGAEPQRWIVASLVLPGGELTIVMTCTERGLVKVRDEALAVANSFLLLDRDGIVARDPQGRPRAAPVDLAAASDAAKLAYYAKVRDESFEKTVAGLAPGFSSLRSDRFLLLHNCEGRYAKETLRHAEALRDWLDSTLGGIDAGLVQATIIEVDCAVIDWVISSAEPVLFLNPEDVRRIEIARARQHGQLYQYGKLSARLFRGWLDQKSPRLRERMPAWLECGLDEYVENSDHKGGKFVFTPDSWERERLNDALLAHDRYKGPREDAPILPLELLFRFPRPEPYGEPGSDSAKGHAIAVVRYFLDGPGAKAERTRGLLPNYLRNLVEATREATALPAEAKPPPDGSPAPPAEGAPTPTAAPTSDVEFATLADAVYARAFEKTFSSWTAKDWAALDRDWLTWAQKAK